MKDYRLFDISDFVMDEDFIRWINQKETTDNEFWDNWLAQHPDKYMIVAEAKRILESIGTEQRVISEVEKQNEIDRLMATIKAPSYMTNLQQAQAQAPALIISKKWWYLAASVLFAIGCSVVYFLINQKKGPESFAYSVITPSKHLIENVNTSEKTTTLKLPDGSTVELSANSRIGYANNFDSATRDVYLSGEAFFRVTKNPGRPFRVFANEIVTKVLGTSFSVRSFEKDTVIEVTVRTGKVSVYSQATANDKETSSPNQLGGIILTPNQALEYEKSKQKFKKALLQYPVVILTDTTGLQNMQYEDAPLEKVFTQLSKIYGISIVYDNELLKKCTVTADLRNESFYRKVELICKAVGAHYEIMDGQVVIQANGCE